MNFVSTTAGKVLAAAALSVFAVGAYAQKTQLSVYTALETDQLKAYKEGFEKAEGEEGSQVAAHSRQQEGRGEKARCQEQARREEGWQGFEEGCKESREKVAKESCEEGS